MYAVVGCTECSALWVVDGRPDTTRCPRCRTRHRFAKLRTFAETDEADAAKQVRTAMLADRSEHGEVAGDLDAFAELETAAAESGMSDDEYLEAAGLDADAVAEAGEDDSGESRSREQVVRDALRELEDSTEESVVSYATDAGVPEAYVRDALERLRRAGEVTVSDGRYRLL